MTENEFDPEPDDFGTVKPRLQSLLLCDAVASGPNGRKTIYGVFDRLSSETFPLVVPTCAVYSVWSFGQGMHEVSVSITDASENILFEPDFPAAFTLDDPFSRAEIVLTLNNLTFPEAGTYWIHIHLDDEPLEIDHVLLVNKRASS